MKIIHKLINISRFGPAAQIGTGANLNNPGSDIGLAVWIDLDIVNQPNANYTFTNVEHGNFNLLLSGEDTTF